MSALRSSGKASAYRQLSLLNWLIGLAILSLALGLVFGVLLCPAVAKNDDMAPTLEEGDILLCDRISLFFSLPRRGQMVYYAHNGEWKLGRVCAFAGEEADMVDGTVYINGHALLTEGYSCTGTAQMETITVPEGQLLVLPDVRQSEALQGQEHLTAVSELQGVVRLRVTPLSRAAIFQ